MILRCSRFLATAILLAVAGCSSSSNSLVSSSLTAPTVDGDLADWAGTLTRFEKGGLMVGVRNDDDRLYIALVFTDASTIRQISMTGLEVWFDSQGGEEERTGIRYPLGFIQYNRGRRNQLPLPTGDLDSEMLTRMFEQTLDEMDVLAQDSAPLRLHHASVAGLEAAARMEFGTLTYEVAIPLSGSEGLDLGISPDLTALGLGIKTGRLARPNRGGAGGGVRGGRGGRGGGRGGRGGGGRGGAGGGQGAAPLELWIQVSLGG